MFSFFKKKTKCEESATDEYLEKNEEKKSDEDKSSTVTATGFAIDSSVRTSTAQAKVKFEKPEYNPQTRKAYYDDPNAHQAAIDKAFSSGETVRDPYSGAELVAKQRDAKIQFGEKWQNYSGEADHIDPLSQFVERARKYPFLTTSDVREIGNADDNFQILSRRLNQTNKEIGKGGSTQQEWADDPVRMCGVAENSETGESIEVISKRIRDRGKAAEKRNDKRAFRKNIENAATTAHDAGKAGAKNAGITAATMSGIMNITAVIKGEKTAEDAIADTIADTGKAAATGYVMGGGLTTLYQTFSNPSSKFIKALSDSNIPGNIITAVIVTGNTLKRYGNGEISTQECLIELGEKGINFATTGYSMTIGQALIPIPIVGAAVGALVGSMMTSSYYNQLINTLQTKELEHQERLRIIAECERASEEARKDRAELESYLATYFKEYQDCFDEALLDIREAFQTGDADHVIAGANQITRRLNGKVYYESVPECKEFLLNGYIDIL